jgi:Tfp pilus assembly protein PilF
VSQNHYLQAIKSFRKTIILQPKAVQAYASFVRAYQALGDEEKSNQLATSLTDAMSKSHNAKTRMVMNIWL